MTAENPSPKAVPVTKKRVAPRKYTGFVRTILSNLHSKDDSKYSLTQDVADLIEEIIRLSLDKLSYQLNLLHGLMPHATLKDKDVIVSSGLIFGPESSVKLVEHIEKAVSNFKTARAQRDPNVSQNRREIAQVRIPITRTAEKIREQTVFVRMSELSRISIAAYVDYIVERVLVQASSQCTKRRITISHVNRGINLDSFLSSLFSGVILAGGGPFVRKTASRGTAKKSTKKVAKKAKKTVAPSTPEAAVPTELEAPQAPEAPKATPEATQAPEATPEAAPKAAPKAKAKGKTKGRR